MKTVLQEGRHVAHKFNIGQLVRLKRRGPESSRTGVYEVVRLVPPDVDGVPVYRIKDVTGRERAVRESEIEEA